MSTTSLFSTRQVARASSRFTRFDHHIPAGRITAYSYLTAPGSRRTMATHSPPSLQSVQNFRDVATSSPEIVRPGLLFRTARLDTAMSSDWTALRDDYGIKSTIDLRSEDEQKAPSPSAGNIQHYNININGSSYSRALIAHLSLLNQARLLFHAATGRRETAIRILGTHAMTPRGLLGLATDTLDASGPEIKEVFTILSKKENYPVVVYCHQGKDRTGLVTALVLLLCRVDAAAIQRDYDASTGSNGMTEAEKQERIEELKKMGLPSQFAGTDAEFVRGVVQHCEAKYGGIVGYLGHIGVDEDMRRAVQRMLVKAQQTKQC